MCVLVIQCNKITCKHTQMQIIPYFSLFLGVFSSIK
nr:MAG TPA: hypothetical protein [Caudoviricetes sp.]